MHTLTYALIYIWREINYYHYLLVIPPWAPPLFTIFSHQP